MHVAENGSLLPEELILMSLYTETNGELSISHENTSMVVWVYGGVYPFDPGAGHLQFSTPFM